MSSTMLQQETQIRASLVADRDDTIAASEANMETNPVSLLDDINNICSQISNLFDGHAGDWFVDLNTPATLESGSQRGVNDLNTSLHAVEKKRVLREVVNIVPITVGGTDDFVVLGSGELPAQLIAAVGAVTTLGTVAAFHAGTFGTHSLDEVSGSSAVSPLNLVGIIDDVTHDPILSGGNKIYGLFQTETAADGHTITIATTTRAQLSFVRINGAGNDLEAVPAADIQGKVIHYFPIERVRLEDLNEQDFLGGGIVDVPAGTTVTRQATYDNQGTTPVDVTTASVLDLEGPGLSWKIRDDLEADLFEIIEGSAGGTSQVNVHAGVDEFDVDAIVNDFASGATLNSGGTRPIAVGVTDGVVASTAGDLELEAAAELLLDDGNRSGSTWAAPVKWSDTTAEWDALETIYGGELSIAAMLALAYNATNRRRVFAVATANVAAGVDIVNPTNIDAALGDLSTGTFVDDYDFYHNGQYLRVDAAAAGPGDVYPGTALASGQIKLNRKLKTGDTIAMIDLAG